MQAKFTHNGKICDFEWRRESWNITVAECSNYSERMVWSGNYDYYKCSITILDARPDDTGVWSCEVESYAAGKHRGYGYNVTAKFELEVIARANKNPTTNTTTTTTTTLSHKKGKTRNKLE